MGVREWFGLQRKSPVLGPDTTRPLSIRNVDGWNVTVPDAGEIVTETSALAVSAVWACANLISGTISSLPFQTYRDNSEGYSEIHASHQLNRVLYESPNYDQTALDFWDYINLSIELWGNGYADIVRSRDGRIIALRPVKPDTMTVKRLTSGKLQYTWSADGKRYERDERDVLHIRGPGGDPLTGMSTLAVGRQAFSLAMAADRSAGSMFRNGMRPSLVIKFAEWLSPEKRTATQEAIQRQYHGAMNAGRPIILEGGMSIETLSMKPEDAQMLETRSFSVEEVCRFFGVPPVMIGHTSKTTSWPTGVEQQVLMFQKFTLRRRIKRIEQAVQMQLLSAEDRAQGITVRFNLEGLLRGDSAARASFYQTMTQIGGMTINEVRRLENLPPVKGGDVPRMQMQNVPITEATNANEER